eukprot:CAMPEP_0185386612 /NCGR_PEP_ID=MMETSP1364-20130426/64460_1 /TAXON_ID=38817 /ORGANISM="Gephyrocapsa oceanica, Strain RCC1303" /LENGTH=228 /DNA_ID=CAMNT_0027988447 /DNA_START=19 /DNA_END=702 /DNA_ORIENTATION=+
MSARAAQCETTRPAQQHSYSSPEPHRCTECYTLFTFTVGVHDRPTRSSQTAIALSSSSSSPWAMESGDTSGGRSADARQRNGRRPCTICMAAGMSSGKRGKREGDKSAPQHTERALRDVSSSSFRRSIAGRCSREEPLHATGSGSPPSALCTSTARPRDVAHRRSGTVLSGSTSASLNVPRGDGIESRESLTSTVPPRLSGGGFSSIFGKISCSGRTFQPIRRQIEVS